MRRPFPATWIVVMDSSRANFWRLVSDENGLEHIAEADTPLFSHLHAHARDLRSDQPGRYRRGGSHHQQDTFDTEHDPHKLEKHDFVRKVVERLQSAHDAHEFARLAIVAPQRTIGEIRVLAGQKLSQTFWREIGKDLVKLDPDQLWTHIAPELVEHRPD
jgi:protein required for attachment to host cells